jgi:hypothetical protein
VLRFDILTGIKHIGNYVVFVVMLVTSVYFFLILPRQVLYHVSFFPALFALLFF